MVTEMIKNYLKALDDGSLDKVLSLFDANAIVVSPLYGKIPAEMFYKDLFADTNRSETELVNIFEAVDDPSAAALHFKYRWTLQNGEQVMFECVDLFQIAAEGKKFAQLTIIYDTVKVRSVFEKNRRRQSPDNP